MNSIHTALFATGISAPDSLFPFFPRTRDREDVAVLKCSRSGVICLNRDDHVDGHYEAMEGASYWGAETRDEALKTTFTDDFRRAKSVRGMGRTILDIGTGAGGFLDLSKLHAEVSAVEPQKGPRQALQALGYDVRVSLDDVHDTYDLITLFHVYEHLREPVGFLKKVKQRLNPGGRVIIEVPHARDWLIANCPKFVEFTLWSEHLILHTRESLSAFAEAAGFNITIKGIQRYNLANHLMWLAEGKPGGHQVWDHMSSTALDRAYEERLNALDQTDTLWAVLT